MKEIKRVKVNEFDWDAFERWDNRIAMSSSRSVTDTLRFLSERGYVWGWSKTSLLKDTHMKTKLLEGVKDKPVYICIGGDVPNGVLHDYAYISYSGESVEIDFGEQPINSKIVITNDGKTTTATLYSNGKKTGIGTAICHDDDVFDIYTGAKLALNRLEKCKKKPEMTDWEKFVKGEVDMRVPKKYIRNFLDRVMKDDLRIWGTMADWCLRCLETDGDDIIVFVDHISKNHIILADVLRVDRSRTVDYIPGMK